MTTLKGKKVAGKFSDKFMKKNYSNRQYKDKNFSLGAVAWGLGAAFVSLALLALILAAIYIKTPVLDGKTGIISLAILIIAMLVGGFVAGRKAHHKGMIHGLVLGILLLIILIVATINAPTSAGLNMVSLLFKGLLVLFATTLGGIFSIK